MYQERALENSVKSIPVLAPRGKILDRDGRVIVDNHSSFSLYLSRENLKMEHLRPIAEGLNLDYDSLVARVHRFQSRGAPQYEPIPIKEELTPGELAFVDSHKDADTFPELEVVRVQQRLYPRDGIGGARHRLRRRNERSGIGLAGVRALPPGRHHRQGRHRTPVQRSADGRGRRRNAWKWIASATSATCLDDKEAIPGKNLQLTIDLDLQAVAELAMENRRGAVVALDPRNGEVLAMVSRPAFDPNLFAGRIRSKDWKELVDNPDHPLLNRAIQAQQAPGSTFKPIMALAGLESGVIDDNFRHQLPRRRHVLRAHTYKCWGKHGTVDLHQGTGAFLRHVSSTTSGTLGYRPHRAVRRRWSGYGHKTGIDLPHEAEGMVPSSAWKIRNFREKWYRRRDHFGGHRPGRNHGDAAANGVSPSAESPSAACGFSRTWSRTKCI